jgi:hypothetical protein
MNATVKTASGGKEGTGFCTPKEDKSPQKFCVPARRVIPIIFIPGIMGSNLRMSKSRQERLKKENNIAWNPDKPVDMLEAKDFSPARRQLQWDQYETSVEIYDPVNNPTGNPNETADQRHEAVELSKDLRKSTNANVLHEDPVKERLDKTARKRGWGEVYFGSYGELLDICEVCFNDLTSTKTWDKVLDIAPANWGAIDSSSLNALSRKERDDALKGCAFPVHAVGYNWLQTNFQSALTLKSRINQLIESYVAKGFDCRKVVLVTHSMGGLVARALVHPSVGNYAGKVLGVVHGVMPAVGAPAAYKRIRCGFEGSGILAAILGNNGPAVSAVLANSPGGLELLPSAQYGNGWLRIKQGGNVEKSLPVNGDPYAEIYTLRDKWYGLLVEQWINPAGLAKSGVEMTNGFLLNARYFHQIISNTYHPVSFAHYGVDPDRPSWESVTWEAESGTSGAHLEKWSLRSDDGRGVLSFFTGESKHGLSVTAAVKLGKPRGAGDQTVPAQSARAQARSGAFKGIFEQRGYEHQASYSDSQALSSTIFSIVRIIQNMNWS